MHGDAASTARGFLHRGAQFVFAELIRRGKIAVDDAILAGLIDLAEVGTLLDLAADHGDEVRCAVGIAGIRQGVLLGVESERVLMAAENVDRVAADAQARTGNPAAVDRIAHRGVGRTCPFRAHVAFCGKTGQQVVACRQGRAYRAFRHGLVECLRIFRARMQEQMYVRVDQPWQQGAVAQVDDSCVGRMLDLCADRGDAFATHQHFARREHPAGIDIEQARRVQHDDGVILCACRKHAGKRQHDKKRYGKPATFARLGAVR